MTDQAFYELERANDILDFIISLQSAAIRKEKTSTAPDVEKIARLLEVAEFYTQEQDQVIRGDKAAIERTMSEHYPKFREAYNANLSAPITPEERHRRQAAVDYARASVGLEGIELDEAYEEHAQRYINGEINRLQFMTGL